MKFYMKMAMVIFYLGLHVAVAGLLVIGLVGLVLGWNAP
jgi:hypothetical protein